MVECIWSVIFLSLWDLAGLSQGGSDMRELMIDRHPGVWVYAWEKSALDVKSIAI